MYKILITAIISALLLSCSQNSGKKERHKEDNSSQIKLKTSLEASNLNGRVKNIKCYRYEAIETIDGIEKGEIVDMYNGPINKYFPDIYSPATWSCAYKDSYDEKGRMTETKCYDKKLSIMSTTVYEYDGLKNKKL